MLDRDGYRPNVAIVVANSKNLVFWGKRIREHSWQFPQGGINPGETPEQAMYRELKEEVGLDPEHVKILGRTRDWLRYEVPQHWIKREWRGSYRGQKQIWYLLRLTGRDSDVSLRASEHPEFDAWRWHDYWIPLESVIDFKRDVYRRGLTELERYLHQRAQTRREQTVRLGAGRYARALRQLDRANPEPAGDGLDPSAEQAHAAHSCCAAEDHRPEHELQDDAQDEQAYQHDEGVANGFLGGHFFTAGAPR